MPEWGYGLSGIFGIVDRRGAPLEPRLLQAMRDAMLHWGRDAGGTWCRGPAGLGQLVTLDTPQARFEDLPLWDGATGLAFTAAARVDNRSELCRELELPPEAMSQWADSAFLMYAYRRWGESCCARVLGDWSFAAWHPAENRLFLARDHFGMTSVYYHADENVFAFASDRNALLALELSPVELDELFLAQVLYCWEACHGDRTVLRPIRRLPPAHCLTVDATHVRTRYYWRLEDVPIQRLARRQDYAEEAVRIFDEAVRVRLRSPGEIGATLSGGLDSSAIVATAAQMLRSEGRRLLAFTAVPLLDVESCVGERFGDEGPLARKTAEHAGNVDHYRLNSAHISPILGCREALRVHDEPIHGAAGYQWLLDVERSAREKGCAVLLMGSWGNYGLSWNGHARDQRACDQLRLLGLRGWLRDALFRLAPPSWLAGWRRRRVPGFTEWCRYYCIRQEFARRLHLRERVIEALIRPPQPFSRAGRLQLLAPGKAIGGAILAQDGADCGLSIRDPNTDPRVLTFAFSIPDNVLIDPATRIDRWVIRQAMRGRVPDPVRLNRARGRQSADLILRLRRCAGEMAAVLIELEQGPAANYVDVSSVRALWDEIRSSEAERLTLSPGVRLVRAILAGLFLNRFFQTNIRPF